MFLLRYSRRWRLIATIFVCQVMLWSALRVVLYATLREEPIGIGRLIAVLVIGAGFDVLASLTSLLPLIFLISVFRLRWLGRPSVRLMLLAVTFFVLSFNLFVEWFFFEEYSARYNHLALDYLMYPDEVFGNIFASYNVPLFVGIAVGLAAILTWWNARRTAPVFDDWSWRDRLAGTAAATALAAGMWLAWSVAPYTTGASRVADELSLNGWAQLVRAYLTSHLDYEAYYAMLPEAEAETRTARLVGQGDAAKGLVRHFTPRGRPAGNPLDIVIIMEESLGSIFSARFSGTTDDPVTPELDRWSRSGMALTSLVANGNRTVRGMEGILCSFLPLPGDSVVKRDRSENVASIARVLAAQGYQTTFFTGGYGLFDNVKPFMTANGFAEFVEQPDYPADAFRTVWGVADEFVFDDMIARQQAARAAGRRWFSATITGSNHKPFDVPPGRVSWPEEKSDRRGAMLYADYAVGRYLTQAKAAGLLDHTVVLVVGDHGSRVYGAEEIPVTSYRVPAVFFSPAADHQGVTIDRLVSQIDLAPTLLSLAGIEYDAPFFGQDLLGLPDEGGRAFVNHNRSIGMLTDSALVVLGLHQSRTFYTRPDRHSDVFANVPGTTAPLRELAADTTAAFQTAYHLYLERRYVLP